MFFVIVTTVGDRCTVREPASDVCKSAAAGGSCPVRHTTDDADDMLVAQCTRWIIDYLSNISVYTAQRSVQSGNISWHTLYGQYVSTFKLQVCCVRLID